MQQILLHSHTNTCKHFHSYVALEPQIQHNTRLREEEFLKRVDDKFMNLLGRKGTYLKIYSQQLR